MTIEDDDFTLLRPILQLGWIQDLAILPWEEDRCYKCKCPLVWLWMASRESRVDDINLHHSSLPPTPTMFESVI